MANSTQIFPDINLSAFVKETAEKLKIPGVAVGVWVEGKEIYAPYGVTSMDNPLPIDQDTLFLLGSITKTYTATALMCLVAAGKVKLDVPVVRYVPELKLMDEQALAKITVLNLLNHTSGLDWGVIADTGEGDEAIACYVSKMAALKQIAVPGYRTSYSQAGYNLIGRIIENVTGLTFEQAVNVLLFEPLGLTNSFFFRDDIMTRRFCVGHNLSEDGKLSIARLWRRSRGDNPGGGVASSVSDLLHWAQFHLSNGVRLNDTPMLPVEILQQMKQPTTKLKASNLGDAIGISWFLRTIDGVLTLGHAGSANGQFAELILVPSQKFAVVSLANAGPEGITFNRETARWCLEHYLGVIDHDPVPLPFDSKIAEKIAGNYANEVMTLTIDTTNTGLRLEVLIKPEIRAAADKELPPDHAPFYFGILPDKTDEYIITTGSFKGQRGFFSRDKSGNITGVDLAGRLFKRTPVKK